MVPSGPRVWVELLTTTRPNPGAVSLSSRVRVLVDRFGRRKFIAGKMFIATMASWADKEITTKINGMTWHLDHEKKTKLNFRRQKSRHRYPSFHFSTTPFQLRNFHNKRFVFLWQQIHGPYGLGLGQGQGEIQV